MVYAIAIAQARFAHVGIYIHLASLGMEIYWLLILCHLLLPALLILVATVYVVAAWWLSPAPTPGFGWGGVLPATFHFFKL